MSPSGTCREVLEPSPRVPDNPDRGVDCLFGTSGPRTDETSLSSLPSSIAKEKRRRGVVVVRSPRPFFLLLHNLSSQDVVVGARWEPPDPVSEGSTPCSTWTSAYILPVKVIYPVRIFDLTLTTDNFIFTTFHISWPDSTTLPSLSGSSFLPTVPWQPSSELFCS